MGHIIYNIRVLVFFYAVYVFIFWIVWVRGIYINNCLMKLCRLTRFILRLDAFRLHFVIIRIFFSYITFITRAKELLVK